MADAIDQLIKQDWQSRTARQAKQPKPQVPKTQGRGGFLTSLISEGGGTGGAIGGAAAGAALGSVVPVLGTAVGGLIGAGVGGFLGGTAGRGIENKVRDDQNFFGEGGSAKAALKEGAISGVLGAGPLRLGKGAAGAIKAGVGKGATNEAALRGANEAIQTPILSKLTGKTAQAGKRLTEAGSGLKADTMPGGIARLDDQAGFMSKYTGTPRTQRVKMETDMKDLSRQVDEKLATTKTPVVGVNMTAKLRSAIDDPNVFPDLDLTQPRAVNLIEKNMKILENKTDAKDLNDFVKTLNATASNARDKLASGSGRALAPNETAALATKRVIDDELTQIPEISGLKKQMAQIFEVTPQVAKQADKGLSSSLLGGTKLKAPIQALNAVQSKAGALLQGQAGKSIPAPVGYASRIFAGRALDPGAPPEQPSDQTMPEDMSSGILDDGSDVDGSQVQDTDPYSPANIQATVKSIISQGGTQKDVAEFLSNAKVLSDISASSGTAGNKPISATAADAIANAQSALSSINTLEQQLSSNPSVKGKSAAASIANPFGITSRIAGTGEYDAALTNAKDVIARLRTGAAISNSEEKRFTAMLPQPADSAEVVQQKLGLLKNALNTIVNRVGGTTEAQDALSAAGL